MRKRRERHEDVSDAIAMTKVLQTPEGKRLYGEMMFAKDVILSEAPRADPSGVDGRQDD